MLARKLCTATIIIAALGTAAPALADDVEGAKRAFTEGKKAYNVGAYDKAIAHYTEGYELSPRPDFLYNIGQCYYQLHNWERAKFFYERYLSERPDAEDAEEVRNIIRELDDRLRAGDPGAGPGPGAGDGRGYDDGRPPDDGRGRGPDTGYDSGPPPAVARTGVVTRSFFIALSAGIHPTNYCGRLQNAEDCFYGLTGAFDFRLWNPSFMSLFIDVPVQLYSDFSETGAGVGVGGRVRLDKWWRFVPYATVTIFNAGFSNYRPPTGGTFSYLRLSARWALGGEISFRNRDTGGGIGLFGEFGYGRGSCSTGGAGCYSGFGGYGQWELAAGISF
ncbi:MAG TPA: tetratricopeptide repeat protein [Myxococcota bacterium]|jgi:hypothetical protein|nr:tetratricopeptide repeat protein [Myxococcota bacterium]